MRELLTAACNHWQRRSRTRPNDDVKISVQERQDAFAKEQDAAAATKCAKWLDCEQMGRLFRVEECDGWGGLQGIAVKKLVRGS